MTNTASDTNNYLDNAQSIFKTLSHTMTSKRVLKDIMAFRRMPKGQLACNDSLCAHCSSVHLPKIQSFIEKNEQML